MEHKLKVLGEVLLIIGGVVLLVNVLSYLVDTVFNGIIAEWFTSHYVDISSSYNPISGTESYKETIRWYDLKRLIINVFGVTVVLVGVLVGMIVYFYGKRKTAQTGIQMMQIKSKMEQHEHALKEEVQRKNDLITYLAHDLKTPLTSVIGYLNLMQEAPDMPAEQRAKYTAITLEKAERLEKLINEFFEITRYNLQQITLEKRKIDLYYMLVQMADEFYPMLQPKGNTIILHADENIYLWGDSEKLARVFNNILKNAVAYSDPDSVIEIFVSVTQGWVTLIFENSGETIPAEKLNQIFDKFFRLDEARNSDTGGAGLGLAIAKEIVLLHGGQITAESKARKTRFLVTLPEKADDSSA